MGDVKLHGSWASAFNSRVIWALKFKGIPFDYIEEDLSNKSPQLVQYNPIHKKIPILVHDGKPICESMTIVEYIDDFWPENPLLPSDPHERALARFWVKFADQKGDSIWSIFLTNGEEREKAIKDNMEIFKIVEDQCLGEKKFFGGDNINIVDIAFGGFAHWLGVIEEIVGLNLLEENFPALHAWTKNFKEVPVIKENLPDRDKMLVFFQGRREAILGSSA